MLQTFTYLSAKQNGLLRLYIVFLVLQGRSRRSGRSGHGRTTFSAVLVLL